jgi:hypothetical protein
MDALAVGAQLSLVECGVLIAFEESEVHRRCGATLPRVPNERDVTWGKNAT